MKFNRDVVTPYLGAVFIVVALSGILMFFHLLDDYTNVVHEFLGLAFALFAILHIITNWRSVENYAKKKKVFLPGVIILCVSITLVVIGKAKGNLERELLEQVVKSPVCYSFKALDIDYSRAENILGQHNVVMEDSLQSILEISVANKTSPEDILELIYNK
ncbi:DUF4405 domain-containing protein [Marinilongibacter aquaticus]|uniref:DUF4405 domain-containing protein n=1 Tax=Marinilongibacter aquaticus TaxID=2975157 RepID=UPI0021BD9DD6|nr:DUF4405 domain-containing protein [Marinilongibacter aquaticus]UBM60806.1 DUF4405 domain-containing protein [Marinilongibacter aquaticus]